MKQEPRIVELTETRLVGLATEMTRSADQTAALWQAFMPRRDEINNRVTFNFISMQVYPGGPAQVADPKARFTKWAGVEVADYGAVPDGMSTYTLGGGSYAVFDHHGPATDLSTVMYIFTEWLPHSPTFQLDDREHFERLPPDYNATDPDAHEEFWIPITTLKERI